MIAMIIQLSGTSDDYKKKFNLVRFGTTAARTEGSRPIKGLLDMDKCLT